MFSTRLKCGHESKKAIIVGHPVKTIEGMVSKFHCGQCRAKYNKVVLGKDIRWVRVS